MAIGRNTIACDNLKYFYYSRNLPHFFDTNKPVFITYRLKFSLPGSIIEELNKRKSQWHAEYLELTETQKQTTLDAKDETFFCWFDELLDKNQEVPQILQRPELTDIIAESYHHFDNLRYQLLAFCIMPNHVHALIYPLVQSNGDIYPIAHITYTWKKYTAMLINKATDQTGSLWQQESYDHLIRSEKELYQVLEYILENPVKAGLAQTWDQWRGTWIREDLKPTL